MVLKQKPIKMKKRAKIHLLPTDKESHITFGTVDGELVPGRSSKKEEPIVIILRNF